MAVEQTFPVIAIDGYSCSGKGTIAKKVADKFNFFYLDTGLLYRAFAAGLIARQGVDDPMKYFDDIDIFDILEHKCRDYLKSEQVGYVAAKVATNRNVRARFLSLQRELAKRPPSGCVGSVLDGRDIATVVFPKAFCKFFFQADLNIRANRRYKQLHKTETYENVYNLLKKRDLEDTTREAAPLRYDPEVYILIDTTHLSEFATFKLVQKHVRERAAACNIVL